MTEYIVEIHRVNFNRKTDRVKTDEIRVSNAGTGWDASQVALDRYNYRVNDIGEYILPTGEMLGVGRVWEVPAEPQNQLNSTN